MRRILAIAVVALGAYAPSLAAQDGPRWRAVDLARQLRDRLPQRIRVQYGTGKVDVRPTDDSLLYSMHLRYDEARSVPLHRYDADQRSTVLGLEPRAGVDRRSRGGDESGELRLALPRTVPLDLDLELGGTQTALDLGGMALQSVRLQCATTDAALTFSAPNRLRMHALDVSVGAADVDATQLANANADQINVRAGVGVLTLDFSGEWTHDVAVSTSLAMGKLVLRVPADVGVRLAVHRIAAGVEHRGFVKRDDAWYSPNWDTATHRLRISAETFLGKVDVEHGTH